MGGELAARKADTFANLPSAENCAMSTISPPKVIKVGVLHRKHPLIKTWRKYFVVLDTYTCKYFEDEPAFYAGHHAVGIISLKGAMVFNGGESATMSAPRIHIVTDPNTAHEFFDHRLTCFSHPDRAVVEEWMDSLQSTIVDRENMEHKHQQSVPSARSQLQQLGFIGTRIKSDLDLADESIETSIESASGRASLERTPLQKVSKKESRGPDNTGDSSRHINFATGDVDSKWLEDSVGTLISQTYRDIGDKKLESVTLEDPPVPSDDMEVLPQKVRKRVSHMLKQFRKNFKPRKSGYKWDLICRIDGVSLYKRCISNNEIKANSSSGMQLNNAKHSKRKARMVYKATCFVPSTPQAVAAVICDPMSRPAWDIDFPFVTMVDNIGASTDVLHVQGRVMWNETQPSMQGATHDHRDVVTEALRIENLNIFTKRGIGSFATCCICFFCSYFLGNGWNRQNCGNYFGEELPVNTLGIDANVFGAVIGAFVGGILVGLLSNFFVVRAFSYYFWGLALNPNNYFFKRDFCILRHTEVNTAGDVEIVEQSVTNVRCPKTLVHTRGEVHGGGFFISPTSRNLWPGSKVEYVIDIDHGGNLLSTKTNEAMMLNRVKVLPALRELIFQCMQQQRFVEKSTWKSWGGGGLEKKYYILERPIGDCVHAERSNLIANVAFRRVWNNSAKKSCWLGSDALSIVKENDDDLRDGYNQGYRLKLLWDSPAGLTPRKAGSNDSSLPRSSFDWVDGLADARTLDDNGWDPEEWMHGMTRLATGGLKGVTSRHKDSTRTLGTRRLFVDVISDVAQDVFHSHDLGHYSDKMATHMLAVESRNLLEACTDNFLYAPNFLERGYRVQSAVERFKLVMAFAVSGLYKNARQTKPVVPDLGEIFTGKLDNGSICILENLAKEPPQVEFKILSPSSKHRDKDDDGVFTGMSSGNESEFSEDEAYENMDDSEGDESSIRHGDVTRSKSPGQTSPNFIEEGDDEKSKGKYDNVRIRNRYGDVGSRWKVKGSWDLITLFKGNVIETTWHGPTTVSFSDGGRVRYTMPTVMMSGVMWGERITEIVGEMIFSDHQNNLECRLRFNPHVKTGVESLFKKSVSDHVRGEIVHKNKVLSIAEGSWLDGLYFDGKPYWEMHRDRPAKITKWN